MRFSLEHTFEAPLDVVETASNSGAYEARLDALPNLGERRVTHLESKPDGSIHRVVRYKLGAQLPAPVVAALGQTATWDEIGDFDPAAHRWAFEIKPHVLPGRIQCHGSYTFVPDGEGRTTRVVDIDLKVRVPLVGGRAEREIRKGLVETMDAEAGLLTEFLAER